MPTDQSVLDAAGVLLPAAFQPGSIQIGATGGDVEISGRVVSPDEERGIRNSVVTMIGPSGFRRTATTSSFGAYRFEDVPRGATYTLVAGSRRYRFSTRVIVANDTMNDVDFVGLE